MKAQIIRATPLIVKGRHITRYFPCGSVELDNRQYRTVFRLEFQGTAAQRHEVLNMYELFVRLFEFSKQYKIKRK